MPFPFSDRAAAARALSLEASYFWREIDVVRAMDCMWERFERLADADFVERINDAIVRMDKYQDAGDERDEAFYEFQQRYWEMYLPTVMMKAEIEFRRPLRGGGPDLCADTDKNPVWIECVAPTRGRAADAVPEVRGDGKARDVPDLQLQLRLLAAMKEKGRTKYDLYIESGIVQPADSFVVAINGACLPYCNTDYDPPRIVRALLGIGHFAVPVNRATGKMGEAYLQPSPSVARASGAAVSKSAFLDGSFSHVSAVIYSNASLTAAEARPIEELIIVHNPTARTPLPAGWLPGARRWVLKTDNGRVSVARE